MCGIVGFVRTPNLKYSDEKPLKEWFIQSLLVDTLRGKDSTGVAVFNRQLTEWQYLKKAFNAWDYVQYQPAINLLNKLTYSCVAIGHNRAATVGKITDFAAHPYQVDEIIGVHNGTLSKHNPSLPYFNTFQTDSEALYHAMKHEGVEKTLETVKGAFACVWMNVDQNTIHMIRNTERTLYYAKGFDAPYLLFGSESGMIEWIADRNDLLLEGSPTLLTPGTLMTVDIKTLEVTEKKLNIRKPVTWQQGGNYSTHKNASIGYGKPRHNNLDLVDLTEDSTVFFDAVKFQPYPSRGKGLETRGCMIGRRLTSVAQNITVHGITESEWKEKYKDQLCEGKPVTYVSQQKELILRSNTIKVIRDKDKKDSSKSTGGDSSKNGKVVSLPTKGKQYAGGKADFDDLDDDSVFDDLFIGPNGNPLSQESWEMQVQDGCGNCGMPITPHDRKEIGWTFQDQPICPECLPMLADVGFIKDGKVNL